MKNLFIIAITFLFLLSEKTLSQERRSASATGTATMSVIEGIFLVGPEPTGRNGIVVSPFTNARQRRGGEGALDPIVVVDPNSPSAASFVINGTPGVSFNIVLPANDTVFLYLGGENADGPSATIPANDFTHSFDGQGVFGALGFATIRVGCSLNVGNPLLKGGAYRGSFLITITY